MSLRAASACFALAFTLTTSASGFAQEPAPSASSGYVVQVDAGAGVMLGLTPGPAFGLVTAILIQSPYVLAVEIVGSIYPFYRQETPLGDARWLSFFGGALVCTSAATWGGFSMRGCAGGELGFMQAAGDVDPTASWVTGHVLVRARLSYRITSGFAVWTRPTFAINARPDAYSRSGTVIFDPEPIGGLFDIGFGWVFD